MWGLGQIPEKRSSVLRRWLRPVIKWFYKNAAGFIGYSRHACAVYEPYGKPTYLASNAVLPAPSDDQRALVDAAIRSRGGGSVLDLVYIGALTPQKHVAKLLAALTAIPGPRPRLHVIGEGSEEARLRTLARQSGLERSVIFHGALYDDAAKWEVLRGCDLGVLPGRGGLAIQELMFYGIPVISGVADGTERDMIDPRRTGFLIDGVPTPDDLRREILRFRDLSASERATMARAAAAAMWNEINVDRMAGAFVEAILTTLGQQGSSGTRSGWPALSRRPWQPPHEQP
ncbi:MAG: glycosyltransferase [Gemmatimonadales bacterium]|nr:MAG: glycosyltransferase [Gemmatimonadales bacterium]